MNKEQDYASDSDESDEDFCLENENDADSGEEEEEDDDDTESESEDEGDAGAGKKSKKVTKGKQKDKTKDKCIDTEPSAGSARSTRQSEGKQNGRAAVEKDELESDEETDKSRSDALWADFLGDVGGSGSSSKPTPKPKESPPKQVENGKRATPAPSPKVTEILDFAGEEVIVSKTVGSSSSSAKENQEQTSDTVSKSPAPRAFGAAKRQANGAGGGLGSLLNQLGKKKKMSVLEKSQLDWKTFKSDEGIDEELRTHNKGKDGYLERQDFLQRTDLRQFEIEKNMRQTRRQN